MLLHESKSHPPAPKQNRNDMAPTKDSVKTAIQFKAYDISEHSNDRRRLHPSVGHVPSPEGAYSLFTNTSKYVAKV